jgi:hypothetical protein
MRTGSQSFLCVFGQTVARKLSDRTADWALLRLINNSPWLAEYYTYHFPFFGFFTLFILFPHSKD